MNLAIPACVFLVLILGCQAQPWQAQQWGRPHPIHDRRRAQAEDFLLTMALFGMDMSEPFMMQYMQNAGMLPRMNPASRRNFGNTLQLLGLVDGPDGPDPRGGGGRGNRRRGGGRGGGRAGGGGEEAAPARKGGGGGGGRKGGAKKKGGARAGGRQ